MAMSGKKKIASSKLTLGPLLFHWSTEKRRDFYYRVADEMDIDSVTIGEAVCSKREPFFIDQIEDVADRLRRAGKEVILSTLALITSPREIASVTGFAAANYLIEANDVSCIKALDGKPHIIGPYINVFNEGTKKFLSRHGAIRIALPVELSIAAIGTIAKATPTVATEVMVFGRQPLSVSMRCYHARAYGLHKDSCQFVCGLDCDGLVADTLDGEPLLAINGTHTMSHGYVVLLHELKQLQTLGVSHFRLSPQDTDMTNVATIYRHVLNQSCSPEEGLAKLRDQMPAISFINGYARAKAGLSWDDGAAA
jgi:O2-independent ubiquinone biosynthesis protein UbiV